MAAVGRRVGRGEGEALLSAASCLLLLLAGAQGYVSFRAQYTFVDHAKRAQLPSLLEALGLDTGAVIFALLALSLARRGKSGIVERVLNVACALGSLAMNLLAADLTSPRSIAVWVMPSALYALASDRLIAVVRGWAQSNDPDARLKHDGSAWRVFGGIALWALRLIFDMPGTVTGFRRWVLAVAPVVPGVLATDNTQNTNDSEPVKLANEPLAPGEKKREALIRIYERCGETGDPRYGNRAKAASMAGDIAKQIGYHPGTARRELVKYMAARSHAVSGQSELGSEAEAVA